MENSSALTMNMHTFVKHLMFNKRMLVPTKNNLPQCIHSVLIG